MLRADVEVLLRGARPQRKEVLILKQRVQAAESEAKKHARGKAAAAFAGHQHIGASRALGINQRPVLFDDQLPPQRDHEQHAQPSAEQRQREDAARLQVEAEEDQRGQGKDDTGSDRLACVASGLDDVVLEDAGLTKRAQDRDRQHRDGDAGRDRQARAQADIHRHRAEEQTECSAQQQRSRGQLGPRFIGRNERPEDRLDRRSSSHTIRILRAKAVGPVWMGVYQRQLRAGIPARRAIYCGHRRGLSGLERRVVEVHLQRKPE
jgi:hypothetical protein